MEGVSDALRMEVAKDGIHVVLIEPGGFKTGIWEDLERDLAKRTGSRYADAYERLGGLQQLVVRADGRSGDLRQGRRPGARARAAAAPLPRGRPMPACSAAAPTSRPPW